MVREAKAQFDPSMWDDSEKLKMASALTLFAFTAVFEQATGFHVSMKGDDSNSDTEGAPFCTIRHVSKPAQPGDVITAHGGVYRERADPPHFSPALYT